MMKALLDNNKLRWACQILLLCLGVVAYANCFQGAFLLDDKITIIDNVNAHSLSLPWKFWDNVRRPVFFLTVAVNYALGGRNVFGYHLFNLFVHLLAAQILFLLLRRVSVKIFPSLPSAIRWGSAFFAAAIWEVHPLQTQSVTYITQRAESLMGMFFLLAMYAAVRYFEIPVPPKMMSPAGNVNGETNPQAQTENPIVDSHQAGWAVLAVVAGMLSLLSKEVGVTLPLIVLLYDRAFVSGSFKKAWETNAFFYKLLLLIWGVALYLGLTVHPEEAFPSAGFGYTKISPLQYFINQPAVIVHYLRLSVWPHPLVFDYAWPAATSFLAAAPALAVVMGLFVLSVLALRFAPVAGFLGLSFFVTLSPSSSFIPLKDLAFEHRMYLPLAFVVTLIVGAVLSLASRVSHKMPTGRILLATGLLVTVIFSLLTYQRNKDYASGIVMWRDVLAKRPLNPRAMNNLATYLFEEGKKDEAMPLYRRSLELNPDPRLHADFGQYLCENGQVEEGIKYFREALALDPDYADAQVNWGVVLSRQGKSDEAMAHYQAAIKSDPKNGVVYNNIGALLANQEKYAEAVPYYEKAVAFGFREAGAYHNLGIAYAMTGRPKQAVVSIQESLRINPNNDEARRHIAEIEENMRKFATSPTEKKALEKINLNGAIGGKDGE